MSRLAARFAALKERDRCALIPYITAGDPRPTETVDLMRTLTAAGADIIELGAPFSDPMADGPVIQTACERALAAGASLKTTLGAVADFRRADERTPVVLMGYLNPIERMGYEAFAVAAAAAGVDGVLTVDMPPEEADALAALLRARRIDPVFLLSPTSTDERVAAAAAAGGGFLYYVSLKGVTGAGHLDTAATARRVRHIRETSALPVAAGFGVGDAAAAAAMATATDAVVTGSAIVRVLASCQDDMDQAKRDITALLQSMRGAMDAARGQSRAAGVGGDR